MAKYTLLFFKVTKNTLRLFVFYNCVWCYIFIWYNKDMITFILTSHNLFFCFCWDRQYQEQWIIAVDGWMHRGMDVLTLMLCFIRATFRMTTEILQMSTALSPHFVQGQNVSLWWRGSGMWSGHIWTWRQQQGPWPCLRLCPFLVSPEDKWAHVWGLCCCSHMFCSCFERLWSGLRETPREKQDANKDRDVH